MLTPAQVIPFLLHKDEFIRFYAAEYLAKAHDPAPGTAEHLWESIEQFGVTPSLPLLYNLSEVPATEKSTRKLLQVLGTEISDNAWLALVDTVADLDFKLLEQFKTEILGRTDILPPVTLNHLQARLDLIPESPETLWKQLCEHANAANQYFEGELEPEKAQRLIEALARHPEFANTKALTILENDSAEESWLEIYCVDLLGATRCHEAVDLLIDRLRRTDNDCILENVAIALTKIGDPSVIKKIASNFSKESYWFRLYSNEIFSRFKHPDSEAALISLIENEPERDVRTFLASSLCELCTDRPDGLELIRRLIKQKQYDRKVHDLKDSLLIVSTMVGYSIDEAKFWLPDIAEERKANQEFSDALITDKADDFRARMMRGEDPYLDETEEDFEDFDSVESAPIRVEPATGRNDPCPCGSGKKYKKCCMVKC